MGAAIGVEHLFQVALEDAGADRESPRVRPVPKLFLQVRRDRAGARAGHRPSELPAGEYVVVSGVQDDSERLEVRMGVEPVAEPIASLAPVQIRPGEMPHAAARPPDRFIKVRQRVAARSHPGQQEPAQQQHDDGARPGPVSLPGPPGRAGEHDHEWKHRQHVPDVLVHAFLRADEQQHRQGDDQQQGHVNGSAGRRQSSTAATSSRPNSASGVFTSNPYR